ncbi:hypothetical protein [Massilia rubra]|uniref:Knr4/Smi1-like domain-containing protein n=1 Tax=Massilia rubra TaxID=2607910 RepID=A0ABX0LZT8_9BURK|nr:hypothetical protein [Massilia rubra]NHZ37815.1 hypothetical protein [Massilia rubra]
MKSLEILVKRWKLESVRPFPPYGESIIRSTFLDAGIEASKDLIWLYGAFGGMDVPDDNLWRLWPLLEVAERVHEANAFGVLFSDYLLDSWAYRIKPNDTDTSAVYVDYYDVKDPLLVAHTLGEFFEKYVRNADELLNQPC